MSENLGLCLGVKMIAVIEAYSHGCSAQPDHGDEFQYCLYGDCGMLHRGAVTLRTARVLAKEIHAETPFSAMMRAIAQEIPVNFGLLIGKTFSD